MINGVGEAGFGVKLMVILGIIQHHTQDDAMVPFVKRLVGKHVERKNTLIVVTIPMTGMFTHSITQNSHFTLFHSD